MNKMLRQSSFWNELRTLVNYLFILYLVFFIVNLKFPDLILLPTLILFRIFFVLLFISATLFSLQVFCAGKATALMGVVAKGFDGIFSSIVILIVILICVIFTFIPNIFLLYFAFGLGVLSFPLLLLLRKLTSYNNK